MCGGPGLFTSIEFKQPIRIIQKPKVSLCNQYDMNRKFEGSCVICATKYPRIVMCPSLTAVQAPQFSPSLLILAVVSICYYLG
jgi:hypothetical protein